MFTLTLSTTRQACLMLDFKRPRGVHRNATLRNFAAIAQLDSPELLHPLADYQICSQPWKLSQTIDKNQRFFAIIFAIVEFTQSDFTKMALSAVQASAGVRQALSKQVVSMFRKMCRDVPKVLVMYNLEQTPAEARHMLLLHYRKASASAPQDPRIIEMMLEKARQEYEETMQQWKQKGHLLAILQPELPAPDVWTDGKEFSQQFLNGTLSEEDVWAGWDSRKMKERVEKVRAIAQQSPSYTEEEAEIDALLHRLATSHLK